MMTSPPNPAWMKTHRCSPEKRKLLNPILSVAAQRCDVTRCTAENCRDAHMSKRDIAAQIAPYPPSVSPHKV